MPNVHSTAQVGYSKLSGTRACTRRALARGVIGAFPWLEGSCAALSAPRVVRRQNCAHTSVQHAPRHLRERTARLRERQLKH